MIKEFKKYLSLIFKRIFEEKIHKELTLKAKILSFKNKSLKSIKDLSEVEFQVYSQWGEDGIIDWLINKFPEISKSFLEIGTENYKESNTRFLLSNNNWNGFLIEADKAAVKDIKSQRIFWKHNLRVENEFITKDNINEIVKKINVPKKLGLLSLDIDGVDYWILNNLSFLEPSIVVCEYNSLFGQKKSVTVPYKKNFIRSEEHYSNLYYGASIKAFIDMMKKKNYFLIGTNSAGNNAFFIEKKLWNKARKLIIEKKVFVSKFRESRNAKGKLNFLDKKKCLEVIKNKHMIDLKDNRKKRIHELKLFN
jgi:hypothetical protein|tara:strand:- start:101 stop:1024 length:924 start_codon:yes stop_codon:yes gene_type:complete